jgi:hypothetical protein
MEKGDVTWGDFLKFLGLFLMKKDNVACYLNFQKYFSLKKDDMTWDDSAYLNIKRIEINDL